MNIQGFHTIYQARKWIKWACEQYQCPVPVVRPNRLSKTESFFRPIDWSIHLLPPHWNVGVALHEAAHAIHTYYYGPSEIGHDDKWLGIFVWLLTNCGAWPKDAITETLKNRGMTYSKMTSPKALSKKTPAVRVER